MENFIDKTEKPLSFLKGYVIPAVVFISGLSVAWAILQSDVRANSIEIEKLDSRVGVVEACSLDTNTRLVRIETQLEEIYKILDREFNRK